jgi:hypothetical protein
LAFNLDHCWAVLNNAPKWQVTQQEYELKLKKPAKEKRSAAKEPSSLPPTDENEPSSPQADITADNNVEIDKRGVLGNEKRPEGNKMAKQKRNDDHLLEKVLKTQEELVKISKERAALVKLAMQVALDERTMAMDLSGMDDESKAYWHKKKKAVLKRANDNE